MRRFSVITALALLLAACAGGEEGAGGIPPQDPELVAQGEDLYATYCAQCHGADLRGTAQGPSQLSEVYVPDHHGDAAYFAAVSRGSPQHHWDFGPMPPVPGLDAQQVEAIIAYIREQQRINGFEPYPPQ